MAKKNRSTVPFRPFHRIDRNTRAAESVLFSAISDWPASIFTRFWWKAPGLSRSPLLWSVPTLLYLVAVLDSPPVEFLDGRETDRDLRSTCRVRHVIFIYFLRKSSVGGGEEVRCLLLFSLPCSADHERDSPLCKVVFFGSATNTLNVRNNKRFDIFPP